MEDIYFIDLPDGTRVPVSKEIYDDHQRTQWREEKNTQRRKKREQSYDVMVEAGDELSTVSNQKLIGEIVEDKLMLETLMSALDELSGDEQYIINELFWHEKTEREVAADTAKTKSSIHRAKNAILKKLKKINRGCVGRGIFKVCRLPLLPCYSCGKLCKQGKATPKNTALWLGSGSCELRQRGSD